MSSKNGYLGGMVLVLAIVLTILSSWVLSLDVTEREVTEYNFVTELTGLFETEQAPAYIEYNPSTNYTGYYTDPETKYFDGVRYTAANQRNAYKLNLAPTSMIEDQSIDLSSITGDSETWRFFYWTGNESLHSDIGVDHLRLDRLLTAESWDTYDEIILVSDFNSWTTGGFITFCNEDMLDTVFHPVTTDNRTLTMRNPNLSGELVINSLVGNTVNAERVSTPILACKYEADTGYAELYYDLEMKSLAGLWSLTDVHIVWGDSSGSFDLGSTISMTGADYPDAKYMDVRQGVRVE